ncbi:MAG TPA: phosphate uptake regulator PhoU [Candidatus Bathyarchaeia archaeon]|jgi:phosphate uptake regulator|nr:phosphate uptake regulator PhoU [Candidatus Bathyarchaeia archaeon]
MPSVEQEAFYLELRKLQRTPDGTYLVTIPKAWAKRVGLDQGSVVSYEERQDGRLLLSPRIEEERPPLEVVLDASPFIRREIIERYLLGYDIIRIQSKDSLSPEMRDEVRKTTKRLVGLEVLEEDSKKIVLQCLIEPSLLNPERILRRLEMLSMPMQIDAVQAFVESNTELANGVVERDEEVDRWYFLLVRLVRAAIADTYLLEKIKVSSVDCLDFRLLASYIETFADYAVTVAENTQDKVPVPRDQQNLFQKIGASVNTMYRDAVGSVLSRDLKLASSVSPRFKEAKKILAEAETSISKAPRPMVNHLVAALIALNRMCEVSVDISDLTITR